MTASFSCHISSTEKRNCSTILLWFLIIHIRNNAVKCWRWGRDLMCSYDGENHSQISCWAHMVISVFEYACKCLIQCWRETRGWGNKKKEITKETLLPPHLPPPSDKCVALSPTGVTGIITGAEFFIPVSMSADSLLWHLLFMAITLPQSELKAETKADFASSTYDFILLSPWMSDKISDIFVVPNLSNQIFGEGLVHPMSI